MNVDVGIVIALLAVAASVVGLMLNFRAAHKLATTSYVTALETRVRRVEKDNKELEHRVEELEEENVRLMRMILKHGGRE